MDDPKPRTQEYHEGEEAARRFEGLVKRAVLVSREEIERRDKKWKKARKRQHKRVRA
jgi:hypothetical protein